MHLLKCFAFSGELSQLDRCNDAGIFQPIQLVTTELHQDWCRLSCHTDKGYLAVQISVRQVILALGHAHDESLFETAHRPEQLF